MMAALISTYFIFTSRIAKAKITLKEKFDLFNTKHEPLLYDFSIFFSIYKLSSTSSFLWRGSVHYQSLRSAASLFRNASLIFVKVVSVRTKKKKKLLAKLSSIVIYKRLNRWCYKEWFIVWNSLWYLISKLEYASNTFMNYLCMIKSITF